MQGFPGELHRSRHVWYFHYFTAAPEYRQEDADVAKREEIQEEPGLSLPRLSLCAGKYRLLGGVDPFYGNPLEKSGKSELYRVAHTERDPADQDFTEFVGKTQEMFMF